MRLMNYKRKYITSIEFPYFSLLSLSILSPPSRTPQFHHSLTHYPILDFAAIHHIITSLLLSHLQTPIYANLTLWVSLLSVVSQNIRAALLQYILYIYCDLIGQFYYNEIYKKLRLGGAEVT
ncbi:hypothetical protein FGO68_gene7852 [Halteria grandinella]|uniref:Uncharacterized protein n=1 Tax=Halteria grandinella TaxID=5974 RepID=A0A8J8NIZ1_HALGN|nr:hypothetical protein FGO68_gene7852 [Halteria grandinella]